MKAKARARAAIAALALSACILPASSQAKEDLVASVLEVTGIEKQFADVSGMVLGMYQGQQGQMPEESYRKIIEVITDSFVKTDHSSYVKKAMLAEYSEEYCREIVSAYRSKLFLDITAREIEAGRPEEAVKIAGFDYSKVSAARDGLFDSFLDEGMRIESQKRIAAAAIKAFIYTYNILLPEPSRISSDVEAQAIAAAEASLDSDAVRIQTKKALAAIYESFSDAQLKDYFGFYSTAEGKWLNDIVMKGFEKSFEACMADAANKLKIAFKLDA